MNLRQLEAFRATMECGSITAAAKQLRVSQPSVSRLIAELERSVGFQLFIRTGHGLTATIEARKFSHSVEGMFIGLDKLRETADAIRNANDETVSLGVIPAFVHTMMPEAVATLRLARPSVDLDVVIANTPDIVDAILLQKLDLGVICPTRHYDGLYYLHQASVRHVALVPSEHPLAGATGPLDLARILGDGDDVLIPDGAFQFADDGGLGERLLSNAKFVSPSGPAIASIARAAGLVSIVDPYTARVACAQGAVKAVALQQALEYPVALVTRSVDALSTVGVDLAEAMIDELNHSN